MIYILNATKRLTKYKKQITSTIEEVLAKYNDFMPVGPLDVVVAENAWMSVPEQGMCGFTSTAHEIYIVLDLGQDVKSNIEKYLASTFAHELAHVVRLQHGLPLVASGHLADNVVGEGLADQLSRELYPDSYIPWIDALKDPEFSALKKRFVASWQESPYDHNAWFYGDTSKDLPRWTGYALGYALVGDYLKSANKKASEVLTIPTSDIVKVWL